MIFGSFSGVGFLDGNIAFKCFFAVVVMGLFLLFGGNIPTFIILLLWKTRVRKKSSS